MSDLAAEADAVMLETGGNTVDATLDSPFALGVVEPAVSGLEGQAVMLLYLEETGRKFRLDGATRVPLEQMLLSSHEVLMLRFFGDL